MITHPLLGHYPIALLSQKRVARSPTQVEYKVVATTACNNFWIKTLLTNLGEPIGFKPNIYCNNVDTSYLSFNLMMSISFMTMSNLVTFVFLISNQANQLAYVQTKSFFTDKLLTEGFFRRDSLHYIGKSTIEW